MCERKGNDKVESLVDVKVDNENDMDRTLVYSNGCVGVHECLVVRCRPKQI